MTERISIDINYHLAREQIELALARASTSPGARAAHSGMAAHYRTIIENHRMSAVTRALATERRRVA